MTINWIKSDGTKYPVKDMETRHLFYTIRLVWNSFMPRPLSVGTYKAVLFRVDIYTPDYWKSTLPGMYDELCSRTDIPARYQEQLATMQMPALLARLTSPEALDEAVQEFLNREDTDYEPEATTWEDEAGKDLSHAHHTLVQCGARTQCPRCLNKFPGTAYYDKAGATCPVCTSQYDYEE